MESLSIPRQLTIQQIINTKSLSPRNYQAISIPRKSQLTIRSFLAAHPYDKGEEPGSGTYVEKSDISFLRNSCINSEMFGHEPSKLLCLNPHYEFRSVISNFDLLLCKDANIGDSCLFIEEQNTSTVISSGIVRLNFDEEPFKFYCMAFFKDEYFLRQLDFRTPRGATIRHSGERFLDCNIPLLRANEDWVYSVFKNLILNIAQSERMCRKKLLLTETLIDSELLLNNVKYLYPTISRIAEEKRCDAGIYSRKVFEMFQNINLYPGGSASLCDYGFMLQRGPNLAKRDLGRSVQSPSYKPNYHILVYPSDISEGGYLLRTTYLGARNPIWYLKAGDILFAAEGTVGKTFVICDEKYKFTTNFHGMIIRPNDEAVTKEKAIFLGLFLNFLRAKGILSLLAVGGQGGSFAVEYWKSLKVPCFPDSKLQELARIYDSEIKLCPMSYESRKLELAGLYQLNAFRMKCESVLRAIIDDLKLDKLKAFECYKEAC